MKQIRQATAVCTERTERKCFERTEEERSFNKNKTVQGLEAVTSSSNHSYLQEAGSFIELLHCAVAYCQVPRVRVGDDDLQGGCIHIPQVDVCLFALAQPAHKHRSEEKHTY